MIYLRSHLDKYLAVDSFGNVTCESEEKEPGSKFQIRLVPYTYFLSKQCPPQTTISGIPVPTAVILGTEFY